MTRLAHPIFKNSNTVHSMSIGNLVSHVWIFEQLNVPNEPCFSSTVCVCVCVSAFPGATRLVRWLISCWEEGERTAVTPCKHLLFFFFPFHRSRMWIIKTTLRLLRNSGMLWRRRGRGYRYSLFRTPPSSGGKGRLRMDEAGGVAQWQLFV